MSKKALIVTRVSGFVPQFEMNNVKILQQMGYEIHYAANFDVIVYGTDNSRLDNTGIICHHIPFGRSPFSRDVLHCYHMLKELMLEQNFDLVHCHMPMTGVVARWAAEKVRKMTGRNIPVFYTAHGFHFYKGAPISNWVYYFIERYFARYTDRLLLINQEDFERGSRFNVRGKVEKLPGVGMRPLPPKSNEFDLYKEYHIPASHKVVVSVGELTKRKNHEVMIRAMDQLRNEKITYVICGTGPLQEKLFSLVKEMHLQEKVIFAGYCENIYDILYEADFFAFPSLQEGLPVAVMEAMQAGLPVIGKEIRGNSDLIENKKGGFLFAEGLVDDYVKGLQYMLTHEEEAKKMGQWNMERVKQFSLEHVDKIMKRIYSEIESEA